jgi:calcineurin-like phosphoesterase family protein
METYMKILCIGDLHFKAEYPYSELISDGRKAERAAVLKVMHDAAKTCDAVVLMGDVLDKKNNPSSVIKEMVEFLHGFGDKTVYIISGNHCIYEGDRTALDFLIGIKSNWRVVTPKTGLLYEEGLLFVPYHTNASLGSNSIEDATKELIRRIESKIKATNANAMFVHHMLSGTFPTEGVNEIVLPNEYLSNFFKIIVAGHIHSPSVYGSTFLVGNVFSHEVGEEEKFIWKFETNDGSYEKISLPVRPIYKLMNPSLEELDVLPEKSIVKVILTEKGQDIEMIKAKLLWFDAHLLVEQYPNERTKMHLSENSTLDLSIESLLDLYATQKEKDPLRLKEAFKILKES